MAEYREVFDLDDSEYNNPSGWSVRARSQEARAKTHKVRRDENNRPNETSATGVTKLPKTMPWRIITQMAAFYIVGLALMSGHLVFFLWLDERPVISSGISQASQTAVANFFAVAAEIALLGGIGVAYNQILWRRMSQKSLKVKTIDKLVTLVMSPWNLWRPDLYKGASLAVLICVLSALVPIAIVFPPGAVGVEFQDAVIPITLSKVQTMNVSDFGSGNMKDIVERSFLQLSGDMEWLTVDKNNLFNPRLISMASGILASGTPATLSSPCGGPCTYDLSLGGPRFHCKELDPDEALIDVKSCTDDTLVRSQVIYRAEDKAREESVSGLVNNTFKISWFPDPVLDRCNLQKIKTLDCSITMAQYRLHISSSTRSRPINITIESETEIWMENDIPTSFYDELYNNETFFYEDPDSEDLETLAIKFPVLQTYAISRAAITALAGEMTFIEESGLHEDAYGQRSYRGNGTGVFGSPYFGLSDLREPKINITAHNLQSFLQDLTVSTMTLNNPANPLWTNQGDVQAMEGSNVYKFNEKMQFFVPYGACLVATAGIYVLGFWSLRQNGASAGNSFIQFATTTSASHTLHQVAQQCSRGGDENVSQELKDLRLRLGIQKVRPPGNNSAESEGSQMLIAAFITENEVRN